MRYLWPGSFAWLLAHDMRLNWRQFAAMFAKSSSRVSWAVGIAAIAALHALASLAVNDTKPLLEAAATAGRASTPMQIAITCIMAWMISQGLLGTSRIMYDRGDLDLLLGSPLPGARIFAARAVSLAASSFGSVGILLLPIANMGAIVDSPHWLSIYPTLAALALIGTTLGSAIALSLFFAVGPRRARMVSSISAAVLAGAFVLSIQVAAMLPEAWREAAGVHLDALPTGTILWLPAAAAGGDWLATAALIALAATLFAIAVHAMGSAFAHASARAVEASSEDRAGRTEARRKTRFRPGLAASLRRKEWRLLIRDPNLFAQLSLQIIYTLPVAVVLLRSGSNVPTAIGLAPVIVVIATQVSASLAWIAVSAEEAPELIAAAPVDPDAVDRAKLSAIALPVGLLVAGPMLALAIISLPAAAIAALFTVAGGASGALLNFWHPMPGKRRGMLRRHAQSKLVAMIEHMLSMLSAVAVVLALLGSPATFIPVALAVTILIACRRGWLTARSAPAPRPVPAAG